MSENTTDIDLRKRAREACKRCGKIESRKEARRTQKHFLDHNEPKQVNTDYKTNGDTLPSS